MSLNNYCPVQASVNRYALECGRGAGFEEAVESEAADLLETFNKTLLGKVLKGATHSKDKDYYQLADYLTESALEYFDSQARANIQARIEEGERYKDWCDEQFNNH